MTRSRILLSAIASLAITIVPSSNAFQMPSTGILRTMSPTAPTGTGSKSTSSLQVSSSLMPDSSSPIPAAIAAASTESLSSSSNSKMQLKTYSHDGWTLKYRYKPAAKGKENEPPILLIHPVGIGISSWFWDELIDNWQEGGAVYAPDLIGCGIDNGSDAWDPEERGLFFPLSWVRGCETLIQEIISSSSSNNNNSILPSLFGNNNNNNKKKVTVVVQGGIAPVGIMLASRNPDTVSNLIMTSPPTWKDMTTAVPETELERNYNFLRSPFLGSFAFGLLENEWAIRFFSNLFLFEGKADNKWMDQCLAEGSYKEGRPPIQAFNAGLLQSRSYVEELTSLITQPVTIVQGKGDVNRIPQRQEYESEMKDCTIVTLPDGLNVVPWECPRLFAETLQQSIKRIS